MSFGRYPYASMKALIGHLDEGPRVTLTPAYTEDLGQTRGLPS